MATNRRQGGRGLAWTVVLAAGRRAEAANRRKQRRRLHFGGSQPVVLTSHRRTNGAAGVELGVVGADGAHEDVGSSLTVKKGVARSLGWGRASFDSEEAR
jgi:hypothetical protein